METLLSIGLGVGLSAACGFRIFVPLLALSAAALYTAPAMAFAGATFPVLAMPPIAKAWSSMLPLTHYLKLFQDQSMRGAPLHVSLPAILALLIFASVGPVLMLPRMKKIMANERYWGRA